jgi:lipopolysaccharide heptosyltransferase II
MFLKKFDSLIGKLLVKLWPRPQNAVLPSDSVASLLVIRPGGIGDAVLLAPAIKSLRKNFPNARIEVLAEKRNAGALALCPEIDHVISYDKLREFWSALRGRYEVVIDSEQWYRLSAIVARMIRSQMKIGYGTNDRRKMFNSPVSYDLDRYEPLNFFSLLQPLKIKSPTIVSTPFLTVSEDDQDSADAMLGSLLDLPFIVLFPGASTPEKCWGVERFSQLSGCLVRNKYSVVVVGGKDDVSVGDAIAAGPNVVNLAGKTSLQETAGILNRSKLLISGDSGVLHIGFGLGKPTVSIFGPSSAVKWAPRGDRHIHINHELTCSPCSRFGTTPPCQIDNKCINDISVGEVFTAAKKILDME